MSIFSRRENFCQMLVGIFRRKYGTDPGDSNVFEALSSEHREKILNRLNLPKDEEPLIFSSFAPDGSWLLISNQNIYWNCEGSQGHLNWDCLLSVFYSSSERRTNPYLELTDLDGVRYKVKVELFLGTYALYNVLKQIAYQRKRAEDEKGGRSVG